MLNPHVQPIEHAGGPSPHAPTSLDDYVPVLTAEQWDEAEARLDELVTQRLARQGIADAPTDLERRRHREGQ